MSLKRTAAFKKHEGWIVAYIREIPGVNTTMEEARRNLDEALTLVMESIENNRKSIKRLTLTWKRTLFSCRTRKSIYNGKEEHIRC